MSRLHDTQTVSAERRPAPRRGHYVLAALFFTFVAIYGSLVPLRYKPLDPHEAWERFRHIPWLNLGIHSRADWVANILLFIPVSYLWLAALCVDLRSRIGTIVFAPLVVIVCALASAALEFTQLWFPPRTVSQNDIVAESIGSVVGVALWIVVGQRTTEWARGYARAARTGLQINWLLQFYVAGLLLYSILPLDLTIHPGELAQKFAAGRIELIPFQKSESPSHFLWHQTTNALLFVPVGLWATTWLRRDARRARSTVAATALGAAVVVGIECAQLLVFSRFTSTTEVVSGTLGVFAGAHLARRLGRRATDDRPAAAYAGTMLPRPVIWGSAVIVYSIALCVLFWWPLQMERSGRVVRSRLNGFLSVPFRSLWRGSEFNATTEVLRKMLLFGGLGALCSGLVSSIRTARGLRPILWFAAVGYCLTFAVCLELAQAAFPPHVSDVTDVIIYAAGIVPGMLVMHRLWRSYGLP